MAYTHGIIQMNDRVRVVQGFFVSGDLTGRVYISRP